MRPFLEINNSFVGIVPHKFSEDVVLSGGRGPIPKTAIRETVFVLREFFVCSSDTFLEFDNEAWEHTIKTVDSGSKLTVWGDDGKGGFTSQPIASLQRVDAVSVVGCTISALIVVRCA